MRPGPGEPSPTPDGVLHGRQLPPWDLLQHREAGGRGTYFTHTVYVCLCVAVAPGHLGSDQASLLSGGFSFSEPQFPHP